MAERPPFVVRSADVPEQESAYPAPFDTERLSFSRELGKAAGSRALGANRERIPPGRRVSFTHAHLREEELVYVLSGRPTLRWIAPGGAPQELELAPGDLAAFPGGTGIAHTVWNRSADEVEVLVIGERKTSERVTYPDDPEYAALRAERNPLGAWVDAGVAVGEGKWPAVRIETPRLVLRPWEVADARSLIRSQEANREHLLPWMVWARDLPTVDEMFARIVEWQGLLWSGKDAVLGAFDHQGEILGGTGFHDRVGELGREIGYWVDKSHQGKGLVSEWCTALVRVGFEVLELDRIEIHCDPANVRSAAVPRRLGFRHEATLPRRTVAIDGRPADAMIWSMYCDDYEKSALARAEVRAWDGVGRRLL